MFKFLTISKNLGAILLAAAFGLTACDKKDDGKGTGGAKPAAAGGKSIVIDGSDTMLNLAQKWTEVYRGVKPDVQIQVNGGGSGVGIAGLIAGTLDLATSSRKLSEKEIAKAKSEHKGKEPREYIVGMDALAVYVHLNNTLDSIAIDDLAEIYGEGAKITKWSQLGGKVGMDNDAIVVISRQNSSGTYAYFHDAVLGKKRDFKLGTRDMSGSVEVVHTVAITPSAIGYSGMGYKTNDVKWLKISKIKGEPAIEPSIETVKSGTYPIARPLLIYTMGEPSPHAKEFLDWIMSPKGQEIVKEQGYVPL